MPINKLQLDENLNSSDIDKIIFSDPLSENTRKVRRNLILASFMCLLIVLLNLKIEGFLGLKTSGGIIENDLAKDISFLVIIYYLLLFLFYSFIDITAWKFNIERVMVKPFLSLVHDVNSNFNTICMYSSNFKLSVNNFSFDFKMIDRMQNEQVIGDLQSTIHKVNNELANLRDELSPFLQQWEERTFKLSIANLRFRVRLLSLIAFDLLFPFILAITSVLVSYSGLFYLIEQIHLAVIPA